MRELSLFKELHDMGVLYTRSHVDRLEAAGKFPKRVHIGEARVAWVTQEIRDWVEAKKKARHDRTA